MFILELLYSDNATFVANSIADAQVLCNSFAAACTEFGMKISFSDQLSSSGLPGNHQWCCLKSCWKVLLPWIKGTASVSLVSEPDARIGKAASTFGKFRSRVWANQHLSIHIKILVCLAFLLSMLLWGCWSWPTYLNQEKRLNAFDLCCLQPILGVSWRDRIPNTTILERICSRYILSPSFQFCWNGHVCRMEDGRLPKDIFYGQLSSAPRPVGRRNILFKAVFKKV